MRIMTEQECSLVEAHMALVETVIRRHITVRPEIPGLEHDDLSQVGSLALCRAAQRYDGRCQFSTFGLYRGEKRAARPLPQHHGQGQPHHCTGSIG